MIRDHPWTFLSALRAAGILAPMMRATFLGWQSWMVSSETTRILLDPVLTGEVGRGPRGTRSAYPFWPPQQFKWDAFPPVDALVLTHEHEDHFDVPTLARIDRRVPVYLSVLASVAARSILHDMGFTVQLVAAGESVRLRDFELRFFCADHIREQSFDEWSTLAVLFTQLDGDGSFFTNVDVAVTPEMARAIDLAARRDAAEPLVTVTFELMTLGLWGSPVTGGATYHGIREGEDAPKFVLDRKALPVLLQGNRIRPVAGQTAVLDAGRLVDVEPSSPFLTWVPPPPTWHQDHSFWGAKGADPIACCGRRELQEEEEAELERGLKQVAEHLYGGMLFRRLHSLDRESLQGRRPTFVWCLLNGADGAAFAYEYRPEVCDFVAVDLDDDFENRYVGVVIGWATDLVSLLRGELDPRSIARGYRSAWNPPCDDVTFFTEVLWPFFHPLRHPQACLRRYRATLAEEGDLPLLVQFSGPVGAPGAKPVSTTYEA
jgi:hypothetical protein